MQKSEKIKPRRLLNDEKFKMDVVKYRELHGNGEHPANMFQILLLRYGIRGYHYFPVFKNGLRADMLVKPHKSIVYLGEPPTEKDTLAAKALGLRVWHLGPEPDLRWLEFAAECSGTTVGTLNPVRPSAGSRFFQDLEDEYMTNAEWGSRQ